MATPNYKGQGQPRAVNAGGLFGSLGSMFGTSTPSYKGGGQPSPSSASVFGTATPIYKVTATATDDSAAAAAAACVPSIIPIDGQALAQGKIAIVIPRDICGPCDAGSPCEAGTQIDTEDVPATD